MMRKIRVIVGVIGLVIFAAAITVYVLTADIPELPEETFPAQTAALVTSTPVMKPTGQPGADADSQPEVTQRPASTFDPGLATDSGIPALPTGPATQTDVVPDELLP